MNRRTPRLLTALLTLTLAAGARAAILAPDDLHFALRGPGEVMEASVWLINTEDEPLEVLGAKASCGCTTIIDFVPQTLAAGSAMEAAVRVTAPKQAGRSKAVSVTFTMRDRPPIRLPIRLETMGSPPTNTAITAVPAELDMGRVTAAGKTDSTVRLTNTTAEPVRVTAAKAGCGCITFPGFGPFELGAGASADVRLSVKAPAVVGRPRTRDITFTVAGHPPVKVPVRLQAVHPLAEALGGYLGPCGAPDDEGRPWYGDFRVEANTVTAIVWAGGATPRARLVCRFDDDGRVRGIRVEPITTPAAAIRSARRQ